MADALQISDSCWFSFYCLVEVLLTENRAQNKIEYHQILLSYALGNEAKRNADKRTGSRKTDHIPRYHASKPQPENEFHKVVPGLSRSSHILRTGQYKMQTGYKMQTMAKSK